MHSACNPQKGRLETLEVEITEENTTWFRYRRNISSMTMITDWKGGCSLKQDSTIRSICMA
jgi:hypothetical protein